MSKLPKDKRDKILAVAMATVVISAAFGYLVIKPQRTTLAATLVEVQKSQDQLTRGNSTLATKEQVNQQFEEARRNLARCETAMAAPNDMYSWLIQTLNTFSEGKHVDIPQFGRELPTEVGVFPKFPYRSALFNIRGTANYHDFGKFLADFENNYPYIRVQNIELDPAGAEAGREKLNFKMELLTLVRPAL